MRSFRHYSRQLAAVIIAGLVLSLFSSAWGTAAVYGADQAQSQGKAVMSDIQPVELLLNGGFEQLDEAGVPKHWAVMGDVWHEGFKVSGEAARTGSYGLMIKTDIANNPWVNQPIQVEEGATYKLLSWFKSAGVNGQAGYKIEFYTSEVVSPETALQGYSYRAPVADMDGQWHEMVTEMVAPPGAKYMYVYLRLYGTGKVYFDDASVRKTKDAPQLELLPNQLYYYTDLMSGNIQVKFTPRDGSFSGKTMEVKLVDTGTGQALFTKSGVAAAAEWETVFDPSIMALNKPYLLYAEIKDGAGHLVERQEKTLYRLERPAALPANGPVLVDEKPFFPVIAYHANISDYPLLREIGVNTVQGMNGLSDEGLQALLDAAHANDLKVMVTLYEGMLVKENMERNKQIITKFKNHPAVLGYMIMDEPKLNGIMQSELLDAYRMIRSLDPVHPTYMVESELEAYRSTGQATDILVTDVYPYNKERMQPISAVGNGVRKAVANVDNIKPVWTVLQTFRMPNTAWDYLPSITQVRNMGYQALLAGSKGFAFYSINDPGWRLPDSELWPGLKAFKEELPLISGLATQATKIAENIEGNVQWGIWQNGAEQYVVAINMTQAAQSVTVPLPQSGNYIELLHGASVAQWSIADDALQVTLQSEQAIVYRVSPFSVAIGAVAEKVQTAAALSGSSEWQGIVQGLQQGLNSLKPELEQAELDMNAVLAHTAAILARISAAEVWVDSQEGAIPADKRAAMLAVLDEVRAGLQRLVQAVLQIDVNLSSDNVVADEALEVAVSLRNDGQADLENIKLVIGASIADMQPVEKEIGLLAGGTNSAVSESIMIPAATAAGDYSVNVTASYMYNGVELTASIIKGLKVSALLSAKSNPEKLRIHAAGTYLFTVELVNHASRIVNVSLSHQGADQLTVDLPASVTLQDRGSAAVTGNIILPAGTTVTEAVYQLNIEVRVEGKLIETVPLQIQTDPNLVYNPGFELAAANSGQLDGWLLRNGVWNHEVAHSGRSSVRLNPDANNNWNTINTGVGRGIDTVPGKKYILSGWVKNGSSAGLVELGLRQADANDASVKYTWIAAAANSDWTKYELPVTIQPNTVKLWVYFKVDQAVNGPAWLDDVELREVP
ncbi:carbohydrate binding domain-containing protein [Paenibacillus sp. GCM10027626]|uniref:carbohydrate binding domain-containing protein n=1 Tax=Paenibacillus sp. GCM10027626 TaxID=3273411 RepID=UPI003626F4AC